MKDTIKKYFVLSTLLLTGLTNHLFAGPALPTSTQASAASNLPTSTQTKEHVEDDEIEIVSEIKIQVAPLSAPSNPQLKEGDACSDEELEEVQGELFVDNIPMAQTIPCDKVDCKDLKPARMKKDNYRKLPNAKTIRCQKK
jgi:hypothetical protein